MERPPAAPSSAPHTTSHATKTKKKLPTVLLVLGMAGSGKTTFIHRLCVYFEQKKVYTVNLDPAVRSVPYPVNVDIRDTIDYKLVMKQFGLGPNGAIMTSLNLFSTKFNEVMDLLEMRSGITPKESGDGSAAGGEGQPAEGSRGDGDEGQLDYIIVDTPGQIEVFSWSASGQIISDLLGTTFPTVCLYVLDSTRCQRPTTFTSNMTYACSILYKTKLPFVCVFNKIDVAPADKLVAWMGDCLQFQRDAMEDEMNGAGDDSYLQSLSMSMAMALDEFYQELSRCCVSAGTGAGMDELDRCVAAGRKEYEDDYLTFLEEQKAVVAERRKDQAAKAVDDWERLKNSDRTREAPAVVADDQDMDGS